MRSGVKAGSSGLHARLTRRREVELGERTDGTGGRQHGSGGRLLPPPRCGVVGDSAGPRAGRRGLLPVGRAGWGTSAAVPPHRVSRWAAGVGGWVAVHPQAWEGGGVLAGG